MIINTNIIIILIITHVGNEIFQGLLRAFVYGNNLKTADQIQDVSLTPLYCRKRV